MATASVFKTMRCYMHRDSLRLALCGQFDSVSQERRIIQSNEFLPVLTAWAKTLIGSQQNERPQPFNFNEQGVVSSPPESIFKEKEVQEILKKSARVRWMIDRLKSGKSLTRGKPVFPSTLRVRGPEWPFQPRHLNWLEQNVGDFKGTELLESVDVEPKEYSQVEKKELYTWRLQDDSDFHQPFERHLKQDNFFSSQHVVGEHEAMDGPHGLPGLPKKTRL